MNILKKLLHNVKEIIPNSALENLLRKNRFASIFNLTPMTASNLGAEFKNNPVFIVLSMLITKF